MQLTLSAVLQILILTLGVYLVLSFLRTTRGSGILRGLVVASLILIVGLKGLSNYLQLDELFFLVEKILGFVVVILAILFQPELRRAMVHLGENPTLGRLFKVRRREVLNEVAQAVVTMANKRQGALIAFERRTPLDGFIEGGVKVDAEVNRFLLDSLFHHGSALHDGAVILRGDRIAAATSLFPLTENIEISKSTGTRHRAALGVTEETDAVTVVVSEETGEISICKNGEMDRRIPQGRVEDALREKLGADEIGTESNERPSLGKRMRQLVTANGSEKISALAIAVALFWMTYQDIRESKDFTLNVVAQTADAASPRPNALRIVLPDDRYHLTTPFAGSKIGVSVTGTRAELEQLGDLAGVLTVSEDDALLGPRDLPMGDIRWGLEKLVEGVTVRWLVSPPPRLEITEFGHKRFTLSPPNLVVDASRLNPRYEVTADIRFDPPSIEIFGPPADIERLGSKADSALALRLEPIRLDESDASARVQELQLDPSLREQGFSMARPVKVTIPIAPATQDLGLIQQEISLSAMGRPEDLALWEPPSQTASFRVYAIGLLPDTDPSSQAWQQAQLQVRSFVKEHLRVFVDLSEAPAEGSSAKRCKIRWYLNEHWEDALDLADGTDGELRIELESEKEILLIPRRASESGNGSPSGGD